MTVDEVGALVRENMKARGFEHAWASPVTENTRYSYVGFFSRGDLKPNGSMWALPIVIVAAEAAREDIEQTIDSRCASTAKSYDDLMSQVAERGAEAVLAEARAAFEVTDGQGKGR